MGSSSSVPVSEDKSIKGYVCITLNTSDKVSIINASPEVIAAIRQAAQ